MKSERQNIGSLFKATLENYQIQPEEGEWIKLDQKLSKVSFYRFLLFNFNIYYCIFILSTFLMSSILFINYFINKEYKSSLENIHVSTIENKIITSDTNKSIVDTISKEIVISINKENNNKKLDHELTIIKKENKVNQELLIEAFKDSQKLSISPSKDSLVLQTSDNLNPNNSAEIKQAINTSRTKEKKTEKPKKVVYISKQDTIIVYDTLNRKKSFSRKRK